MIQGLVLAAGQSTRFGRDKMQLKIDGKQTMVAKVAQAMKTILPETMTVLSRENAKISTDLALAGNHVVFSERSHQGLNHTIADGIELTSQARGWVIAMGDMPFVKVETIQLLVRALELGAHIALPCCQGKCGFPAAFSFRYRQRLLNLDNEESLHELLQAEDAKVTRVTVSDPGILFDIDQPEDLTVAAKFFSNS